MVHEPSPTVEAALEQIDSVCTGKVIETEPEDDRDYFVATAGQEEVDVLYELPNVRNHVSYAPECHRFDVVAEQKFIAAMTELQARRVALGDDDTTLVRNDNGFAIRADSDDSAAYSYLGEWRLVADWDEVTNSPTELAKKQLQTSNGDDVVKLDVPTDVRTLESEVLPYALGWLNGDSVRYGLTDIDFGDKQLTFELVN